MQEKLYKTVRKFVSNEIELRDDMLLKDDLGLSSLNMMLLIFELETELNTKIELMDLVSVKTLGQLKKILKI